MNFKEWWEEYNRKQIFEENYSLNKSMAIKALAEEAWRAGRDAWHEVVNKQKKEIDQERIDQITEDLLEGEY